MNADPYIAKITNGEIVDFDTLLDAWARDFPLLNKLEATQQEPQWHGEGNVAIHTDMVLQHIQNQLAGTTGEHRLLLVLAAFFHDIGKALVTRQAEVRGALRWTSPRHAEHGRNYLALRLPQLGITHALQDQILSLVGYHHHPRKLVLDNASVGRYAELHRQVNFDDIITLQRSDLHGRVCDDLADQLDQLALFKLQTEEYALQRFSEKQWQDLISSSFSDRSINFQKHALCQGRKDLEQGSINMMEEALPRAYNLPEFTYTLTLLCGPSGSGKSTWIDQHASNHQVISLDSIREQIAGKRANQKQNGQVIQAAKKGIKQALRDKKDVIFDATNIRVDGRSWVTSLGYNYGAFVKIVCFRNSIVELHRRNKKRQNPIPTAALDKQIQGFEWPTIDEAHEVIVTDT